MGADGTSSDIRGVTGGVGTFLRRTVIALIAFLTTVDLFATQALVPSLAAAYDVSPPSMGVAVNASTLGMAVAGRYDPSFPAQMAGISFRFEVAEFLLFYLIAVISRGLVAANR